MALHNPHLRHHLVVSCPGPGHIGHGIKDPHQAPVLLTQCGTQQTQQQDVLRLVYPPLLQTKTI
jgi:hypothetical protein